jgi:LysM repeat protein
MRTRIWAILIGIGIIALAAAVLINLFLRGCAPTTASPTSTAVVTLPSSLEPTDEIVEASTTPSIASPTPPPLLYTIQEGDTLGAIAQTYGVSIEDLIAANGLADPDVLDIGQTLIIPVAASPAPTVVPSIASPTPTVAPSIEVEASSTPPAAVSLPTSLPTLTPSGPPLIEVGQVLGSGDVAAEVVVVRNRGGAINLEGWTLSDAERNSFTFPAVILFEDAELRIHSAAGKNTPNNLYWGRTTPAWSGGELIALRDSAGSVVNTYIVP